MLHKDMTVSDGIHIVYHWSVADTTARDALSVAEEDIGKICRKEDNNKFYILENNVGPVWGAVAASDAAITAATLAIDDTADYFPTNYVEDALAALGKAYNNHCLAIACSDETTSLSAGTAKVTFRMPYAMTVARVKASLTTAQASGNTFTVDINEAGVSILSTKLTVDNTEKTSSTAATPAVISDANLADDAEITVDIDQIGDGTAKGLKVYLIGKIV